MFPKFIQVRLYSGGVYTAGVRGLGVGAYIWYINWVMYLGGYIFRGGGLFTRDILMGFYGVIYIYIYIYIYIQIYSDVMKTIQCAHTPHHHNGFAATCRLWRASGGVHALLVLEPTECSTSTRLGA